MGTHAHVCKSDSKNNRSLLEVGGEREKESHLCLDSEFFFVLNMLGIVLFRKSSGNTIGLFLCLLEDAFFKTT